MSVATLVESELKEGRKIHIVPMSEIIANLPGFNCRGKINPSECIELAQEIKEKGLLFPVILRPFRDEVSYPGKKYAMVAGHRRHMAHVINKSETIEAEIRWNISEADATLLNLTENLEREDLNLIQEGNAFQRLQNRMGYSQDMIAAKLHRSLPWVVVRIKAIELEPEIQTAIKQKFLTQSEILQVWDLPPGESRYEAVRQIKSAKFRGDKRKIKIGPVKPKNVHAKKRRDVNDIFELQDHMLEEFGGGSLARCPDPVKKMIQALGWTAGEASDMEIYTTLRTVAEDEGMAYNIPESALAFLKC
jgi:ParB family transcriptional regulator, chromosome partitioning protein